MKETRVLMSFKTALICFCILIICSKCEEDVWKVQFSCCPTEKDSLKVICIRSNVTKVVADGKSTILLSGCIPTDANKSITNLTFEVPTDAGLFKSEGGTNLVTKNLDVERSATALLTVGRKPGIYKASVKVQNTDGISYSDELFIELIPIDTTVVSIVVNDSLNILRADNTSLIQVRIKVDKLSSLNQMVNISINGPAEFLFEPAMSVQSFPLTDAGTVFFLLRLKNTPGSLIIKATVELFTTEKILNILPANPAQIIIVPKVEKINASIDSVSIDFYLQRLEGLVSNGIYVNFKGYQIISGSPREIGQFIPPFALSHFEATNAPYGKVIYRLLSSSIIGPDSTVYIVASSINDFGMSIQDTTNLSLK